jgi:hypothetical protein
MELPVTFLFNIIDIFVNHLAGQDLRFLSQDKNIKITGLSSSALVILLFLSACNPTKYVPEGETLLEDYQININREAIKKSDIMPYIRQKPNKKIFGARFHLGLYNLSNLEKEKWPHAWLRNIGEEPAIFDPYVAVKSKDQLKSYLSSKGYFDGLVKDSLETVNRKTRVHYDLLLKPPYTVRNIIYEIADTNFRRIVFFDTLSCMIVRGNPYDVDLLKSEQNRLERFVRDIGYYNFSGDNISFRVDSMVGNRQVDIYYLVDNYLSVLPDGTPARVPHLQYRLRNIYIYPDYIPRDVLAGGEEYQKNLDTVSYNGIFFITNAEKPTIKYDLLTQALYIKPGSTFNLSNTERSQIHLMSLKTYRLVNIRYNEADMQTVNPGEYGRLDCIIQLTPMSRQSFSVELEGTNSGGNLGGALNFIYQNKNLFRGAEQFNMKLKGAYETFPTSDRGVSSTRELGIETSLRFPKFLVPFLESENFIRKYNPSTSVQAAYNYQELPVYTRTVANAAFGYNWSGNTYTTHIFSPLQLNMVKIPVMDSIYYEEFIAQSTYLINSYQDVLIAGGSYSYIFSTQKMKKSSRHWFARVNFEAAGNFLRFVMDLSGKEPVTDSTHSYYNVFNQPFAQYVKADVDLRFNRIINDVSSVVYRGFIGVGVPYRNSIAMPFEKQYFEGGANGIRGWQVRSLGPGSYIPPEAKYINQTGDIKIEANIEYRFKLFWSLEGAVFVDAGNIWAIKEDPERPGAQFEFGKFHKDIAVGSGFGMRFDLKFVLFRIDMGVQLRDPKYADSRPWLFGRRDVTFQDDAAVVIGIGYPF